MRYIQIMILGNFEICSILTCAIYTNSDIKPELFSKVPALGLVVNNVANSMLVHFGNSKRSVEEGIWSAIDRVINTKMCDIYTFIPPAELEPDAEEGNLWSFFYFFYNKPDKRIVFFTARGVRYFGCFPRILKYIVYWPLSNQKSAEITYQRNLSLLL